MSAHNIAADPRRAPRNVIMAATRIFNPVAMLLAGTPLLPLYGVIHHVGRRSGKQFRTPVVVRRSRDGLIVPMPWGDTTDWYRNVRAAGGCTIRWKGRTYQMVDPRALPAEEALATFSGVTRMGMRRFGIKQVLVLRFRA